MTWWCHLNITMMSRVNVWPACDCLFFIFPMGWYVYVRSQMGKNNSVREKGLSICSRPCGFRQEDYFMFSLYKSMQNM